ncbi:hypothetical protein MY3296_003509 [Beauveria thailandica]
MCKGQKYRARMLVRSHPDSTMEDGCIWYFAPPDSLLAENPIRQ